VAGTVQKGMVVKGTAQKGIVCGRSTCTERNSMLEEQYRKETCMGGRVQKGIVVRGTVHKGIVCGRTVHVQKGIVCGRTVHVQKGIVCGRSSAERNGVLEEKIRKKFVWVDEQLRKVFYSNVFFYEVLSKVQLFLIKYASHSLEPSQTLIIACIAN